MVCGIVLAALAIASFLMVFLPLQSRPTTPKPERMQGRRLIVAAQESLARSDFATAKQLALESLEFTKSPNPSLMLAAEASAQLGELGESVRLCMRVEQDGSAEAIAAMKVAGELSFRQGKLLDAEHYLSLYVGNSPADNSTRQRLIYVLGISGRLYEAIPHLLYLLQQGGITYESLLIAGNAERVVNFTEVLQKLQVQEEQDALTSLGLGRVLLAAKDAEKAVDLFQRAIKNQPQLIEAHVRLGEALEELADWSALAKWHENLPRDAVLHSCNWTVQGQWAVHQGKLKAAARCYWEAIRRDPNNRVALYQLGQLLLQLGEPEKAQPLLARHELLNKFVRVLDRLYGQAPNELEVELAAQVAEELGRLWESHGWYAVLESVAVEHSKTERDNAERYITNARLNRVRLQRILSADPSGTANITVPAYLNTLQDSASLTAATTDLAMYGGNAFAFENNLVSLNRHPLLELDLSSYPLPEFVIAEIASVAPSKTGNARASTNLTQKIALIDVTRTVDIDFQYFCSPNTKSEGKVIYEFGGGGIAAIDFENDGWPDLVFTQGCEWPPADHKSELKRSSSYQDQFYRNMGDGKFRNVTIEIRSGDQGFGQGVTGGDFDSDGFFDLYVANIGCNRLLRNNGDGTFADVTELGGLKSSSWTTSCVMVDLNGDLHPDIYDVNYLDGTDIFTRICRWAGGRLRICGPATFGAADDQIWLNNADGSFTDVSEESGILLPEGNGLGIVAADFDGTGKLSLFVANDQTANFHLVNAADSKSLVPRFEDHALVDGLAYDADGTRQACMGVAAGDANLDGLIDLFVTNYCNESNTLYCQSADGRFQDITRQTGLRAPSLPMLGFGTQFIDIELDGSPDLLVTNGHLDDFAFLNQAYEMPPQFFSNKGNGNFLEVGADDLGKFFHRKYRGRSMARLDWNRDGKEDIVIGHLDSPTVLLSNQTANAGNYLAFRLIGKNSPRDPVGTSVHVTVGEKSYTKQLTAGDGYQASNERILVFGLGSNEAVELVEIRWPSGLVEKHETLKTNTRWVVVEGEHFILE